MRNFLICMLKPQRNFLPNPWLFLFLLTLGLTTGWNRAAANSPQSAPPQLKTLLSQIDTAATQGNVKMVIQYYSPNFTQSDGLTVPSMEKALIDLWQRYPKLKYSTELQSWKSEGNDLIAETVTNITSTTATNNNNLTLTATIKSRQRISGDKIIKQEVLAERTQLTSGMKPPTLEIKLPQQVTVGQQYSFDAIVQEPLGTNLLLGTALEEPIQLDRYLNPTAVNLQLLQAGGIFKTGRAPSKPESRWLSAVVLTGQGMTMVTQRLQVVAGQ